MIQPGSRLAHYEVVSAIGKGGMGEVWRAKDTKLGRDVAIKTLPAEFAQDADRLARFEREAKLLASLNHSNIAAIHGFEEDNGTHFLVMELVEGDTLADRVGRGAIPVEESLKLALQIVDALKAAHEKGVIHRDLKPANIKVTDDNSVKVLDFGLAKVFAGEQEEESPSNSPTLSMQATQQGVILGTAAYMSPEQAKGRAVDRRADIWAFGCVLYEMLTGQQVFGAEDITTILARVVDREPDFSVLPANLHPQFGGVLERCLQKDVKRRYQDIGDLRLDMENVLADPSGLIVPPAGEGMQAAAQSRLPWVAAVVGILIASVAVWILKPTEPGSVRRFDYELPEGVTFSNTGRQVVTISPDGDRFIYRGTDGFYLRAMDELEAQLIAGVDAPTVLNPTFSPDGQEIVYVEAGGGSIRLMRVAVNGGAPIEVSGIDGRSFGMSWERNGTILYGQPDGIWQVSQNGGTPVPLISTEAGEQAYGPQLLPGGEWLLFTLTSSTGANRWDEADIVIESLSSGERQTLIQGGSDARYVPTGHLVYALGDVLLAHPFDIAALELGPGPGSVVQGVRRASGPENNSGAAFYDFSDDGTLVYVPGTVSPADEDRRLVTVDRDGSIEPISDEYRSYWRPRVSPDGTRVAIEVTGGDEGATHIWLMNIATGIANQLTFEGSLNQMPLWTADSQTVVFRTDRLGEIPNAIFRKSADLIGPAEPILERDGPVVPTDLSTDGILAFHVEGEAGFTDIWTVDIDSPDSAEVFLATPNQEQAARFSPDSQWLAYVSNASGELRVYVRPYPRTEGGQGQLADEEGFAPVWSPDGSELYSPRRGPTRLTVTPIQTNPFSRGRTEELFLLGENGLSQNGDLQFSALYDIMPGGQRTVWVATSEVETIEDTAELQIIVVENWLTELRERVPLD